MMGGVAGAGKITYAQRLEQLGYIRLFIDEGVWSCFGRYDVDYPADEYPDRSHQAALAQREKLQALIAVGQRVVDNAFWNRQTRDDSTSS